MNARTIIPVKIDPSPDQQARDPDNYTIHDTCEINIKQVFNGHPHNRQLRLCMQWPQSQKTHHQQNRNHYQILDSKHLRMEQDFVEKIFPNYDHLKGKYIGCFCKDQMDELSRKIKINMAHDVNPRAFALINTGHLSSSGEHWMGLVMNKVTKCCGYFDSFGRYFKWLHEPLKKIFNEVQRTSHIVQAESSQTCRLHTIYFIVRMMNPNDVTNIVKLMSVNT